MNNGQINQAFLSATDPKTRTEVLGAIGKHYGISQEDAFKEVTSQEAEHLLDYLTGSNRAAVSVLMQRRELNAASDSSHDDCERPAFASGFLPHPCEDEQGSQTGPGGY